MTKDLEIEEVEQKESPVTLTDYRYCTRTVSIDQDKLATVLAVLKANIESFGVYDPDTKRVKDIISVSTKEDKLIFTTARWE